MAAGIAINAAQLLGAGVDRIWSNGTLLSEEATRAITANADTTASLKGHVYAIQSDRFVYLIEDLNKGSLSSAGTSASDVMFAIEGDKLYLLADDEKEHETRLVRQMERAPSAPVAAASGAASASGEGVSRADSGSQATLQSAGQGLAGNVAGGSFSVLPEATPIRMRMNRTVSSADAQVDEHVDFETLDDVKVGDLVVVPRGSTAIATITRAVAKRRMARGGELGMNIDYVRLPSGERLPLRGVQDLKGGGHVGGMTGGMVATAIVFWPAAPFFLFMHGKDVTIPKGHEVTVYTNSDYRIPGVASPVAATTDGKNIAPAAVKMTPGAALTNADVVKLKAAGLGDQLIISKIKASAANYRLGVDDLVELKRAGIPEDVIAAMIEASQR